MYRVASVCLHLPWYPQLPILSEAMKRRTWFITPSVWRPGLAGVLCVICSCSPRAVSGCACQPRIRGQHTRLTLLQDAKSTCAWAILSCRPSLKRNYIYFLLKNKEIAWCHLWPNNCRFNDSCWVLVIIFMLNLHKPEVVIDILQIDVALPDLSKCQFNWTWNIYSKSNILKLIDTFISRNQIFQYLVCNQYQHLCISDVSSSDSESNANISTLWNYSLSCIPLNSNEHVRL